MAQVNKRRMRRVLVIVLLVSISILLINPARTLFSFRKSDQIPLYTMTYFGPYYYLVPAIPYSDANLNKYSDQTFPEGGSGRQEYQACTIFSATGGESKIYGRNRDLPFRNTALLLFTHPKNGYASVSMVDLDQLGVNPKSLMFWKRLLLLAAPLVPTEGMNEHGLVIAKADVPRDSPPHDPSKESLLFRTAMRLVLDQARTTQEAIDLLAQYNISFGSGGGHFLIADPSGDSAIVEYFDNEVNIIRDIDPWQVITNFEVGNTAEMSAEPSYERYRLVDDILRERNGELNAKESMDILNQASGSGTLWSIVFDMTAKEIDIVLFRQFENIYDLSSDGW